MQVTEPSDRIIDEFSVGRMEYHCSHCNAKFCESENSPLALRMTSSFPSAADKGRWFFPLYLLPLSY